MDLLETMQTAAAKLISAGEYGQDVTPEMFNRDHGNPMLLEGMVSKGYLAIACNQVYLTESGLRMLMDGTVVQEANPKRHVTSTIRAGRN